MSEICPRCKKTFYEFSGDITDPRDICNCTIGQIVQHVTSNKDSLRNRLLSELPEEDEESIQAIADWCFDNSLRMTMDPVKFAKCVFKLVEAKILLKEASTELEELV